jgi:hypothetical protein
MGLRSDAGLLAEEYNPKTNGLMGSFPQPFSHVAALQTWMTSGDQMGGIILTDILKRDQLFRDFGKNKFPALQVSIDAAVDSSPVH